MVKSVNRQDAQGIEAHEQVMSFVGGRNVNSSRGTCSNSNVIVATARRGPLDWRRGPASAVRGSMTGLSWPGGTDNSA